MNLQSHVSALFKLPHLAGFVRQHAVLWLQPVQLHAWVASVLILVLDRGRRWLRVGNLVGRRRLRRQTRSGRRVGTGVAPMLC